MKLHATSIKKKKKKIGERGNLHKRTMLVNYFAQIFCLTK